MAAHRSGAGISPRYGQQKGRVPNRGLFLQHLHWCCHLSRILDSDAVMVPWGSSEEFRGAVLRRSGLGCGPGLPPVPVALVRGKCHGGRPYSNRDLRFGRHGSHLHRVYPSGGVLFQKVRPFPDVQSIYILYTNICYVCQARENIHMIVIADEKYSHSYFNDGYLMQCPKDPFPSRPPACPPSPPPGGTTRQCSAPDGTPPVGAHSRAPAPAPRRAVPGRNPTTPPPRPPPTAHPSPTGPSTAASQRALPLSAFTRMIKTANIPLQTLTLAPLPTPAIPHTINECI